MSQFITTKDELNTYYKFNSDVKVSTIDNHLLTSEEDFLLPILGSAFFDEMIIKYADQPNMTTDEKALLVHMQRSEVELAGWMAVDDFNVSFGSAGLTVLNDKQSGIAPASEARTEKLKLSLKRRGLKSIDRMIGYLYANPASFDTWKLSSAFGDGLEYFINTPEEFQNFHDINNSRFLYIKMLPTMKNVEQQSILTTICQPLFDEIKAEIKADTLSPKNVALLQYIRPAVANATFSKSVIPLGIRVDKFGISMFNNSFSGSFVSRQQPATDLITKLIDAAYNDGQFWLKELKDFLQQNADIYPLYKDSACYTDTTADDYQGPGIIKVDGGAIA